MQNTHNNRVLASIIVGLLVIISAALLASNGVNKGNPAFAPRATIQTSSTSSTFLNATHTIKGGINIAINSTRTDRLNRNINFTVNATRMRYSNGGPVGWDSTNIDTCNLNITYPNGTKSFELPMIQGQWNPISKSWQATTGTQVFYYNFRTNVSIPAGNYIIQAFPSNGIIFYRPPANGFIGTPPIMQVYNINPTGYVTLNSTNVYRNSSIGFNISVSDPETPYLQLTWNVTMFQESTGKPLGQWQMGSAFNESYFFNTTEGVLGGYHFVVMVYDGQGGKFANNDASPFTVKDNPPIIHAVQFTPELEYGSPGILRVHVLSFVVNLTDVDNPWYTASVYAVLNRVALNENFTSGNFTDNKFTYNYTGSINVSISAPVGNYSIIITATDLDGVTTYYKPSVNGSIIVRDNPPTINSMSLDQQILVNGTHLSTNEMMAFSINVTDIDQNLDFLELRFQNQMDKNDIINFNITIHNDVSNVLIVNYTISSSVLSPGAWNVWVIAHDFDGIGIASPTGTIAIDPDTRDITATVIGAALILIAGFVVGGMAVWRYANSKIKDIRRDMIIKGRVKPGPSDGKKIVEKKLPPKAGKKGKYQ
ncbi:MAG TPA: hypothetical protein VKM55_25080 [Candidatus Lokiarchaeia archaeon]|nr:hypothetical protein [Candidatus Lokiarchaeia archaeon]